MRKGQETYRDGYVAVEKVSRQYRDAMAKLGHNTAVWQLMDLLSKSPYSAMIGELRRSDRNVHFGRIREWSVGGKPVRACAVPEQTVQAAIGRLRKILAASSIMYAVWASKPMGNRKDGSAKEAADFTVGLVHIDKHEKISRYKGKKAEPSS